MSIAQTWGSLFRYMGRRYMSIYKGFEHVVIKDGEFLPPAKSLKLREHSPTGFSWGYGGAGPAQLALALLLEETSEEQALALYQIFKWQVVAGLDDEFALTSQDIQSWLNRPRAAT